MEEEREIKRDKHREGKRVQPHILVGGGIFHVHHQGQQTAGTPVPRMKSSVRSSNEFKNYSTVGIKQCDIYVALHFRRALRYALSTQRAASRRSILASALAVVLSETG